jgi:hypothetical protein
MKKLPVYPDGDDVLSRLRIMDRYEDELVAEFLVVLARNGIAPDIQEALLKGRALHKAIATMRKRYEQS